MARCVCGMRCQRRDCSLERVLSIEHEMDAKAATKAIDGAVRAGWVRLNAAGKYEHVSHEEHA